MKAIYYGFLVTTFLLTANFSIRPVSAADPMDKRESTEKIEKDIAKDKDKVSSKMAEITTAQSKLNKDMTQYGNDSSQVRDDRESLMSLRNDLVDLKADLYKDTNKKKVAQGQPIETDKSS